MTIKIDKQKAAKTIIPQMFKKIFKRNDNYLHNKKAGVFKADKNGVRLAKIDSAIFFNMDYSLAITIRDCLKGFAETTVSYPASSSPEQWKSKILEISELFNDYTLEYFELEYTEQGKVKIAEFIKEYDEIKNKPKQLESIIEKQGKYSDSWKFDHIRHKRVEKGFKWLGRNWGALWE